jgi:hypothetical protein
MRHPNYRLVKKNRSYLVEEIARLFDVHRGTVREWVKRGLPTCDSKRPILILGSELAEFLKTRREKAKRPCPPGHMYCLRCRTPRTPAGGMVDYLSKTANLGMLVGLCPVCSALMYRRVNPAGLDQIRGNLDVALPKGARHIDESSTPFVNLDLKQGAGS